MASVFRIVLALDLLGGLVVHARRGERDGYLPLNRTFPQFGACTLHEVFKHYDLREAYVADLDRITGTGDNLKQVSEVSGACRVMLDYGVRRAADLDALSSLDVVGVLGTETCPCEQMREAASLMECSASIDVKDGKVLAPDGANRDVVEWATLLDELPLRDVLLLDLRRVGAEGGPDLELAETAAASTGHPLLVGGGVRGVEDLEALEAVGAAGAIVATAAHRGAIPAEMLAATVSK